MRMNQRTPLAFNVMIGLSMRHLRLDEIDSFHIKKRQRFISVPNLENLTIDSSTEFDDEYKSIRPSKSLNTISLLSVQYLDNGENLFNTDDPSLTISERVLKILGISNNYVENILSRNDKKSNGRGYKKFKSSNNPLQSKNIMNTSMQSSDVCSSNEKSANIEKNLNAEIYINPTSRDKFIENYSEWSEQWTMNNILNKNELTDNNFFTNVDRAISVKDNYCQWSSDSESCDTLSHCYFEKNLCTNKISTKSKLQEVEESEPKVVNSSDRNMEVIKQENVSEKVPKKNYNFIDESVETVEDDKIIFTTWIRDLIYVEILKKEVGLFEDNSDNIAKRIVFKNTGTDSKDLTEAQAQTQTDEKWPGVNSNQINFVTVNNINLPKVNDNEYSKYSSDYINLLMKSSGKQSFEITREREEKELKALKAYNEATLWKDKRLKDMERLKKAPIESISLSKNKFEMKNHSGKKIVHKKYGENSGFKNITKNLNFNLLYNKNNNNNLQTHRKLDRSRATVNIPNLQSLKTDDFKISKLDNKIDILENGTKNALNSKISQAASPIIKKSTGLYTDIKSRIANINWSLLSNNDDRLYKKPRSRKFEYKRTGFDFIDDRDIITLLQSAFSFDPRENDRGFYLGPASTVLYSVTNSDQIPNVFNEIIKAARLTIVRHECPYYSSTREIDFGDDYLSDLQTFGEKDNQQYYESTKIPEITEIIRDDNNNNNDDTAPNLQQQKIFLMDYWFQKYKELVVDSNELSPQKLAELARLPGFYLFKKLISQINCSLMVSMSTVVSMASIESDHAATTSRTFDEPTNPEISENAESPGSNFDENQLEEQDIDTIIRSENICMNETYQNIRIYDDYCNWSDQSRTYLNLTDKNSEISLGNESNMSEFA